MESFGRCMKDIANEDRRRLEHFLGQSLSDNQVLVIRVSDVGTMPASGLNDEEIEAIDRIAKSRTKTTERRGDA